MTLWNLARNAVLVSAGARVHRGFAGVRHRLRDLLRGDEGMSTAEYAIGTLAAAAFASLLYAVVTSDVVREALTSLVQQALEGSI